MNSTYRPFRKACRASTNVCSISLCRYLDPRNAGSLSQLSQLMWAHLKPLRHTAPNTTPPRSSTHPAMAENAPPELLSVRVLLSQKAYTSVTSGCLRLTPLTIGQAFSQSLHSTHFFSLTSGIRNPEGSGDTHIASCGHILAQAEHPVHVSFVASTGIISEN